MSRAETWLHLLRLVPDVLLKYCSASFYCCLQAYLEVSHPASCGKSWPAPAPRLIQFALFDCLNIGPHVVVDHVLVCINIRDVHCWAHGHLAMLCLAVSKMGFVAACFCQNEHGITLKGTQGFGGLSLFLSFAMSSLTQQVWGEQELKQASTRAVSKSKKAQPSRL